ncbi:MAG: hypothetical protein E6K80_11585, partial [Candidatus Eisenbacteria bacterium]
MDSRHRSNGPEALPSAPASLRYAVLVCGGYACLVGLVALLGWFTANVMLQSFFAGGITIKTNTAICLLLSGLSLPASLVEHLSGWNLGFDQLLFREAPGAMATASPNRMGVPGSICFPLLGAALLLLGRPSRNGHARYQLFALSAMTITLVPLLGYLFDVHELFGVARYTGIALHTAISLALLGLGILFARPDVGLMRRVMADDGGGLLIRRMLPIAILLPIVLGWLRIAGQELGLFGNEFGRILLIVSFILAFSGLIWWMGGVLAQRSPGRHESAPRGAEPRVTAELVRTRFHEVATAGFVLTMAVLILGAGFGYLNSRRLIDNDRLVEHSEVVIA